MCCPYSENKGADQLRGHRKADLRLCFRIGEKPVFSQRGTNSVGVVIIKKMMRKFQLSVMTLYFMNFSDDGRSKPPPRKGTVPDPTEYKCLVRASLTNKKISTVVRIP